MDFKKSLSPGTACTTTPDDQLDDSSFTFSEHGGSDRRVPSLSPDPASTDWPQSQQCEMIRDKSSNIVKRKPIPRKGHTKSRRGCFSCKRRKIKCQETKPSCEHCQKAGIVCEYPSPPAADALTVSIKTQMPPLQSTPIIFSMRDMQFFHHFLLHGFPTLPAGAKSVWTSNIAGMAHQVRRFHSSQKQGLTISV